MTAEPVQTRVAGGRDPSVEATPLVAPSSIWDFPERALSWPFALVILATLLIIDLAALTWHGWPESIADYAGAIYVLIRFALLPIACACHLVWNIPVFLIRVIRRPRRSVLIDVLSAFVSAGYLVLVYFWPLPVWAGLYTPVE